MIKNHFLRNLTLIIFVMGIFFLQSCMRGESRREDSVQDSIRIEQQRREALERANRLLEEGEPEDTAEDPDTLN
jgi:hypothetical protein